MGKVAWDYIKPVVLPKDLKGVTPGKLSDNLLKPIPGGGKLHWLAAAAWLAMVEAAKADGVELKPTSAGDTYRTYESQLVGFKQRYQLEPIDGASTRTFEGKKWFLKKGNAPLAAPGSSQHNLGIACDVANAAEPKRIQWLIDNVANFGWSWEVVPEEPWHIRYVCGDNPPPAVRAYMEKNGIAAPAPAAKDPEIVKLQEALKAKNFYKGDITGVKDDSTDAAIKAFKVANKLPADSVPGPKVKELLGIK